MKNKPAICRNGAIVPIAIIGLAFEAHTAELRFSLAPAADHQGLGSAFVGLSDWNGDGVRDLAVADRYAKVGGLLGSGTVHVVSGLDGTAIRDYSGMAAASQSFGSALAAADVNGDGNADLIIGIPGRAAGAGGIQCVSGVDGSVLQEVNGAAGTGFGGSITSAGDQNGDGREDLFVGALSDDSRRGRVHVISGATGAVIRSISTDVSLSSFGAALARLSDVDGDGLPDVAISAPGFRAPSGNQIGRVVIHGSATGAVLASLVGNEAVVFNQLSYSMVAVPDTNGDGFIDLMVGSYNGGVAKLLSGFDLSELKDLSMQGLPVYRPLVTSGAMDINEDGVLDFLLGSSGLAVNGTTILGGVRWISGADGSVLFETLANGANTGLGLYQTTLPGIGFGIGEPQRRDPVTNGSGYASLYGVVEAPPIALDTDGDGVTDDVDAVVNSDVSATIVILGIDSKVPNRVDESGTTLADRYVALGDPKAYSHPARYAFAVLKLTHHLFRERIVTEVEARKILFATVKGKVALLHKRGLLDKHKAKKSSKGKKSAKKAK